jgi:hypothetical protein
VIVGQKHHQYLPLLAGLLIASFTGCGTSKLSSSPAPRDALGEALDRSRQSGEPVALLIVETSRGNEDRQVLEWFEAIAAKRPGIAAAGLYIDVSRPGIVAAVSRSRSADVGVPLAGGHHHQP